MISTEQKAIIRRICKAQSKSLLRVMEQRCEQIQRELYDEGYEVSFADIAEQVAKELIQWDQVKDNPEKFLNLLDEQNVSMVKHHLVQDYLGVPESKDIWKQINIRDSAFERRN
jgi:two-component sensor histidine kinase